MTHRARGHDVHVLWLWHVYMYGTHDHIYIYEDIRIRIRKLNAGIHVHVHAHVYRVFSSDNRSVHHFSPRQSREDDRNYEGRHHVRRIGVDS